MSIIDDRESYVPHESPLRNALNLARAEIADLCLELEEVRREAFVACDRLKAERDEARAALTALREEYLEDLADSVAQGCQQPDGTLDSACLSTWAYGIRKLAEFGRVRIVREYGRGVIAEWIAREDWPELATFAQTAREKGASDG